MQTQCSAFDTVADAHTAVERLLADGMPGRGSASSAAT